MNNPNAKTPAGIQFAATLARRRIIFALAVALTCAALSYSIFLALGLNRKSFASAEGIIFFLSLFALPSYAAAFWNASIGLWLLQGKSRGLHKTAPFLAAAEERQPVQMRTAVLMTVRNEDPERAISRLAVIRDSLNATGNGALFDYFLLSDTSDPEIAQREETLSKDWLEQGGVKLFYRRREVNEGFKAGNIRDFLESEGKDYDLALTLDADSIISGDAIIKLVSIMQAYPKLGILQSAIVSTPAKNAFARLVQFGMRVSVRPYTMGNAWWAADCGPYWGHNAVIRIEPFRAFCELTALPGGPPLGGPILSHDLLEAALMRKAGFEVRVSPLKGGTYDDTPPDFTEFATRDLRWGLGNLQYINCLFWPGLHFVSRIQLCLWILMYLGPAAMTMSIALALVAGAVGGLEHYDGSYTITAILLIYSIYQAPKLIGIASILLSNRSAHYGGWPRLIGGAVVEILFSSILSMILSFKYTVFVVSLFFGKTISWGGQARDADHVRWADAAAALWLETLSGVGLFAAEMFLAPKGLVLALPVSVALSLSIPFAVLTSSRQLSAFLRSKRVCGVPEEFESCEILERAHVTPLTERNAAAS